MSTKARDSAKVLFIFVSLQGSTASKLDNSHLPLSPFELWILDMLIEHRPLSAKKLNTNFEKYTQTYPDKLNKYHEMLIEKKLTKFLIPNSMLHNPPLDSFLTKLHFGGNFRRSGIICDNLHVWISTAVTDMDILRPVRDILAEFRNYQRDIDRNPERYE